MLLGRAYQHIRWGGPFRDIFYDPNGFGGWYASIIKRPLKEIYTDHFYENLLSYFSDFVGVVFFITAIVILFYESLSKLKGFIYATTILLCLVFYGFLYGKNLDQYGMFFEHSAQLIFPLIFLWSYQRKTRLVNVLGSIAIAVTYICHGLYAYGYYPQPGHFVDMMIIGLGMTEDFARNVLVSIGIIDFVFAIIVILGVFIKQYFDTKSWLIVLLKINLWYGIVWGLLTSIARVYTSYVDGMLLHWADQYFLEFLVRIPHFALPYFLLKQLTKR
jgi:hypothetical protein